MQARAADSGQGDQGSPAVRGARVRACGGWLPVAGLFVLSGFFSSALFQDGLAAHKKTPSHRHRSSSIPQIIPQKTGPGSQAGEAEGLYYAGVALHAKGNYEQAVEKFRSALQKRNDFPEARHAMGLALAAQGALDEAINEYRAALDAQPEFAAIHNNLGVALSEKRISGESSIAAGQCHRSQQPGPRAAEKRSAR